MSIITVDNRGGEYGIEDLIRDLQTAPAELEGAKHDAQTASAELTAREAAMKAQSLGSVARKASSDIRWAGTEVRYGGSPWSMGAEFGAIRWHQFKPWRGNQDQAGYFLWPTVRKLRESALPQIWLDRYKKHVQLLKGTTS